MNQPRLYLALDTPDLQKARRMADQVNDVPGDYGFKINLDAIVLNGGVGVVSDFRERYGRQIFPDLKMWNGGRTMAAIVLELASAGAALTNIYTQAGVKFMRRLKSAVSENDLEMEIFGLGVLTHYTDEDCQRLYRRDLAESVNFFAHEVADAGLDGYIQPGTCLKGTAGMPFKRLVPAVRPPWFEETKANEQEQTVTPEEAFADGADIVVCGSPVFKSPDPAEALNRLLQEM